MSTLSTVLGALPLMIVLLLLPRSLRCPIGVPIVSIFLLACMCVVSIFLSNVAEEDALSWFIGGLYGIFNSMLALPSAFALTGLWWLVRFQNDLEQMCLWFEAR